MPSASAKLEKQASTEATDPLKQVLVMIEHKRRNLEKRKLKLEGYREEQKNGKDMPSEKLAAVAKYDEVCKTLEFAVDMAKQVQSLSVENAKNTKKQQRKEQLERTQGELGRIRELLIIQDVMTNMGHEGVRADFLAGKDGAPKLTPEELNYLDELYPLLAPKREEGIVFAQQVATAAEHFLSLMEGRSKELMGSTYLALRELLQRINTCGYFEQNLLKLNPDYGNQEVNYVEEVVEVPLEDPAIIKKEKELIPPPSLPPQVVPPSLPPQQIEPQPIVAPIPPVAETASYFSAPVIPPQVSTIPAPQFPPLPPQQQQQQLPPMPPTAMPVPLRQQQRPLSEVIGQANSSFNFLQDSQLEMESPSPPNVDLAVMLQPFPTTGLPPGRNPAAPAASAVPQPDFHQAIPTQTFTNQSFSVIPPQVAAPVVSVPTTIPVAAPHIPAFAQHPVAAAPYLPPAVEPPPPIPMPPRVQQQEEQVNMMPQASSANVPPPSFAQAATTYSSQAGAPKPQRFESRGAPPGFGGAQQKLPPVQQQQQQQQYQQQQIQQKQQQQSQFQPIPSLEQAAEQDREQANWADARGVAEAGGVADGSDDFQSGQRSGGYRGRGGRGGRGRGGTNNGFSGRGRGGQQNGERRSGGYQNRGPPQERNSQEGGERNYENGLPPQRDYSSSFKRGGPPRDRDNTERGPPRDRDNTERGPPRDRDNNERGPPRDRDNTERGPPRDRDNTERGPPRDRDNTERGPSSRGGGQGYRGGAPFRGGSGNPGGRGNTRGGNNPRPQNVRQ